MAVADLGVAMGPRNRRRLASGATGIGVIAVIAGSLVLLARSPGHSGHLPARSTGQLPSRADKIDNLVYGMSKRQVLRRAGLPTKTVGSCWEYRLNEKIRGGQNTLNAERVCFLGGVYSYSYSEVDGKWYYPDRGSGKLPRR